MTSERTVLTVLRNPRHFRLVKEEDKGFRFLTTMDNLGGWGEARHKASFELTILIDPFKLVSAKIHTTDACIRGKEKARQT
jgi:hypothetical protein